MMHIKIKENAVVYSCNFLNIEKESNVFFEKTIGTYIRKIQDVEIFKFSSFFKKHKISNLEKVSNCLVIKKCVLEDNRFKNSNGVYIGSYNPFPQEEVLGNIDTLVVILDKETNWFCILDESDYERYNVGILNTDYLKYDLGISI